MGGPGGRPPPLTKNKIGAGGRRGADRCCTAVGLTEEHCLPPKFGSSLAKNAIKYQPSVTGIDLTQKICEMFITCSSFLTRQQIIRFPPHTAPPPPTDVLQALFGGEVP